MNNEVKPDETARYLLESIVLWVESTALEHRIPATVKHARRFLDRTEPAQPVEAVVERTMPYTGTEAASMMRVVIDDIFEQAKGTHETAHQFVYWHLPRVRSLLKHIDAALAHPRPTGDAIVGSWSWLRGVLSGMPSREEPIGGQHQRYLNRDEVMAWLDEGERRAGLATGANAAPTGEQAGVATCERCGATSDKDAERRCIPDGDSCPGCEEPLNSAWQAGEVVAWQYRSPAQVEFGRKPTLTEDAELVRLMREAGDHEIVELVAVDAAQPRAYGVPDGKAVAFRIVGRNGPYRWIDVSLIEKDNPPEAVIGDGERVEYAYAGPRPSTTEESSAVAQPRPAGVPEAADAPLAGHWHHGNGHLVCGGFRIARADWEHGVCAAGDKRKHVFDWVCQRLNAPAVPTSFLACEDDAEIVRYLTSIGAIYPPGWKLVPLEPTGRMRIEGFECGAMTELSHDVVESGGAWPLDCGDASTFVREVYVAMVSAAPAPGQAGEA